MDISALTTSGDGLGSLRDKVTIADDTTRRTATVTEAATPLRDVLPAAIYHPGTEVPEGPSDFDLYMQLGRPPRTDGSVPRSVDAIEEDIGAATGDLMSAFNAFWQNLSATDPLLAQQKFGFSVDKNGKLIVLDSQGTLSKQQSERLSSALSQSRALVEAANRVARFHIERVESDDVNRYGRFQLDMNNYAQTIDLGQVVAYRATGREIGAGFWFVQLSDKGDVRYGNWVKIVDGKR